MLMGSVRKRMLGALHEIMGTSAPWVKIYRELHIEGIGPATAGK